MHVVSRSNAFDFYSLGAWTPTKTTEVFRDLPPLPRQMLVD